MMRISWRKLQQVGWGEETNEDGLRRCALNDVFAVQTILPDRTLVRFTKSRVPERLVSGFECPTYEVLPLATCCL
jgi:hypothetical protein